MTATRTCARCPAPVTRPHAAYCDDCRWQTRGKRPKYVWTPERDDLLRREYDSSSDAVARLSERLRFPGWQVKKRAARLGLTRQTDRREWTPEEERFLFDYAGQRHVHWMAKRLGRTEASVTLKLKRMQISQRLRDGYTMRELEMCFGVDHKAIQRWIDRGLLDVQKRDQRPGTDQTRRPLAITDQAVLRFIQAHPMEFELRRVDQFWFMDLITDGGLVRRALASHGADEEAA